MAGQSATREPGGRKWSQPCDPRQMHTHALLRAHYPLTTRCPDLQLQLRGELPNLARTRPVPEAPFQAWGSAFPRAPCGAVVAKWVTQKSACTASHSTGSKHGDLYGPVWSLPGLRGGWWTAKAENVGWVAITENICVVYQDMKSRGV